MSRRDGAGVAETATVIQPAFRPRSVRSAAGASVAAASRFAMPKAPAEPVEAMALSGLAALFDVKTGERVTTVGDELDTALAADITGLNDATRMGLSAMGLKVSRQLLAGSQSILKCFASPNPSPVFLTSAIIPYKSREDVIKASLHQKFKVSMPN